MREVGGVVLQSDNVRGFVRAARRAVFVLFDLA